MKQVLHATQTTSDVWTSTGAGDIILDSHAGGTWTLQVESPGGNWIDTDVTWTDDGIKTTFKQTQGLRYRITGGTAGARAWTDAALR